MVASVFGGLDQTIWSFFRDHPFLISFAKVYTRWGVSSVLTPIAVLFGVVFFKIYKLMAASVVPIVALQLNGVLTAFLKRSFAITRPPQEHWLAGAGFGSFPSGHTANTTALVVSVALVLASQIHHQRDRRIIFGSAGVLITLMGWSRLALNVHWFSDVVAGWVLGSFSAYFCALLAYKLDQIAPVGQMPAQ